MVLPSGLTSRLSQVPSSVVNATVRVGPCASLMSNAEVSWATEDTFVRSRRTEMTNERMRIWNGACEEMRIRTIDDRTGLGFCDDCSHRPEILQGRDQASEPPSLPAASHRAVLARSVPSTPLPFQEAVGSGRRTATDVRCASSASLPRAAAPLPERSALSVCRRRPLPSVAAHAAHTSWGTEEVVVAARRSSPAVSVPRDPSTENIWIPLPHRECERGGIRHPQQVGHHQPTGGLVESPE